MLLGGDPGEFEGFVGIEECPDTYSLAVLELDHGGDGRFDCGPLCLPRARRTPIATSFAANVTGFRILDSELRE